MIQLNTLDALRQQRAALSGTVALVPTMGNLHAGHIELVKVARQLAEHVVVSIFVNPMQFSGGEDIDAYPRTLAEDKARLEHEGVTLLFTPPVKACFAVHPVRVISLGWLLWCASCLTWCSRISQCLGKRITSS